jgi:hypothetical protein
MAEMAGTVGAAGTAEVPETAGAVREPRNRVGAGRR